MDGLVEKSDAKLRERHPNIVVEVRERISEFICLTNEDLLDIMRPRAVAHKVWIYLINPYPKDIWLYAKVWNIGTREP